MTMKYITGIILLFYSCVLYGQNRVVTISDQGTFDDINSYIETAKKDKIEKLTFVFEDGLYRFNDENSINIDKNSTTELYFEARNDGKVHIMSAGEVYTKDEGEEVSMSDVIRSSDKQAEARRQAKLQREREERAAQQARFAKRDRKPRVAKEEKKEAPAAEATPVVEEAAPATENTENN